MTENEAIRRLKNRPYEVWKHGMADPGFDRATEVAISALEEVRQYRSIGTVEECREAMEKQSAKKPNLWGDGVGDNGEIIYDMYDCPSCGKSYEIDYEEYTHCPECGQAIDWRKIND